MADNDNKANGDKVNGDNANDGKTNGDARTNGHGPFDHDASAHTDPVVVPFAKPAPTPSARPASKQPAEPWADASTRTASHSANHVPLINLPPVTKYFAALLLLIHAGISFLHPEIRYDLYMALGFVPGRYTGVLPLTASAFTSPLTYMLIHGSWLHLLMNVTMLLAFGAGLERWMGPGRMILFFVACGLAALLLQFALSPDSTGPVIGASGGLSGFFAAVLIMMQKARPDVSRYGLWPIAILWVVISIILGVTGAPDGSAVAWAAHIGGFVAGFVFLKPIMAGRYNI